MRKTIAFTLVALFLFATAIPANAVDDIQSSAIASNRATSGTTAAVATGLRNLKSVFITGQTSASAFTNYSGVITIQEGYAAAGPFVTAKDINGNAVTATHTNTVFHLNSLATYIRAVIVKTNESAAKHIGIYLNYAK
jgi:hypothetical protein